MAATPAVWVTADDLRLGLVQGPWTADDKRLQDVVVTAVDAYIKRVRSDLTPPSSSTSPAGTVHSAFSVAFDNAFVPPAPGGGGITDASWAALQLALHWWGIRGSANPNTYEEFGMTTAFAIPRFVEEALEIGRSHKPVIA